MATCRKCDKSFGFLELKGGVCKSCEKILRPQCARCEEVCTPDRMDGAFCKACHLETERKQAGMRLEFAKESKAAEKLSASKVKTVFVSAQHDKATNNPMSSKSGHIVRGCDLATATESACNDLMRHGYRVISITPITSGCGEIRTEAGMGYSFTAGVMVAAEMVQ